MADKLIAFPAAPGTDSPVLIKAVDNGDGTWSLGTTADIASPTINVGPVELRDASTTDEAKVAAGNTILSTDIALAVHDPTANLDGGPAWTSVWGVSNAPVTSSDMSGGAVAVTALPTTGQKLVLDDIILSSIGDQLFTLTEETSGTVIFLVRCPVKSTVHISPRGKRKLATANKRLFCQSSSNGAVEVLIGYHSEA